MDLPQNTDDDVAWSSENSNTDDEDTFGENPGLAPVSRLNSTSDIDVRYEYHVKL